jgi:hypothetical protein
MLTSYNEKIKWEETYRTTAVLCLCGLASLVGVGRGGILVAASKAKRVGFGGIGLEACLLGTWC